MLKITPVVLSGFILVGEVAAEVSGHHSPWMRLPDHVHCEDYVHPPAVSTRPIVDSGAIALSSRSMEQLKSLGLQPQFITSEPK